AGRGRRPFRAWRARPRRATDPRLARSGRREHRRVLLLHAFAGATVPLPQARTRTIAAGGGGAPNRAPPAPAGRRQSRRRGRREHRRVLLLHAFAGATVPLPQARTRTIAAGGDGAPNRSPAVMADRRHSRRRGSGSARRLPRRAARERQRDAVAARPLPASRRGGTLVRRRRARDHRQGIAAAHTAAGEPAWSRAGRTPLSCSACGSTVLAMC